MVLELNRAASAQETRYERGQGYKSCVACTGNDLPGFKATAGIAVDAIAREDGFMLQAQHEACPDARWVYESRAGRLVATPPCR